jgi:glycosyltransferase involved in cell wall biosynthesis
VDIAIGNSQPILDELAEEGVEPRKLRLLHNGIDPAAFAHEPGDRELARSALGLPEEAFVIVSVGNLHPYKGHGDLIEACALASAELPSDWFVAIAGRDSGDRMAAYEQLATQRGIRERVRFLGECKDVPQVLSAADVFVHPSHHEGLPNAIIEAMAASLPVIATAVGGVPEAVVIRSSPADDAEETGWLVAPHEPGGLAAALIEAAADPARRRRMGERARRRVVAEFSLAASVAAYERIYRELIR